MRINFHGKLVDERQIRAGFIGCGSHAFRNIYPTLQFVPVELVATCDLSIEKARAFAKQFGADHAYDDYRRMIDSEELDAVFVVTGYDRSGRPTYPEITCQCLDRGCHVWIEKPPAASCVEIDRMRESAQRNGKNVVVGLKKMFFPANVKAKELMSGEDFGQVGLVTLQYPQHIPTVDEMRRYIHDHERVGTVIGFLDHLCHPMSLLVFLMGMPKTLFYQRSGNGGGVATFTFDSGAVASLALTCGAATNGGMERTMIVSCSGRHIIVDNSIRLTYFRNPPGEPGTGYGSSPNFFTGNINQTAAMWEPEFSLGQLYNKGIFLLGYYSEISEFARSVLDGRPPQNGTLDQAWQITRVFEAFAGGPGRVIEL